ncbi:SGNH hydrolase domain-containing protein [Nocardioides fonticola]|uniref:SGNH hydrolase domain-containing protein n=1 Tax=Nocardioides fonticola TaxID=450363 RepID=A0ABP7Y3D4_9ACTN
MPSLLERATAPLRRSGTSGRADIQGLRALAVLAVLADHAWGRPVGGFVGVDVFFVLSGFLITGLLVAERDRKGRISYLAFYRRRVRRLLPAACLVLAATIVASALVYPAGRARTITADAVWAFFFASNWHFAAVGTDYFATDGVTSPLQHFWSLAVEEQFYLVWPTLIVLTVAAFRRERRVALIALTSVITLGSFAYSLHHTSTSPTWAYFSTFDRAWELGVGALLALLTPQLKQIPMSVRPVLGWAGLIGILASLVVVSDGPGFPAPWAALPVLSTAAVLAAGTGSDQPWLVPLTNRVAGYVGDISYSLYLWHFPVIILLAEKLDPGSIAYDVLAPLIALVFAMLGYHLLEDPIRRSTWLEPRWKQALRDGWLDAGSLTSRWLAIGTVVAAAIVTIALQPRGSAPGEDLLQPMVPAANSRSETPQADYLARRIDQSLGLKRFPSLSPSVDQLGIANFYAAMVRQGCASVTPDDAARCRFGPADARRTAVVFGDSYAMAYMPAVRAALDGRGYRIHQLTLQDCPAWAYDRTKSDGSLYPECTAYRKWAIGTIRDLRPDLLILATSDKDAATLVSGATGAAQAAEVEAGVKATLDAVQGLAKRTVVLAPPPGTGNLTTCAGPGAAPSECVGQISSYWFATRDIEQRQATQHGDDYLDTQAWFCRGSSCPAFVGDTPVAYEGNHITYRYSTELGPVLAEALFGKAKGGGGQAG